MAKIRVPEPVFPGFKIIGNLTDEQSHKLADYLATSIKGKEYGEVVVELSELLQVNSEELVTAILSFNKLVNSDNSDIADLSKNLAESYKELSKSSLNTKELNRLKSNIFEILSNYKGIKLNLKFQRYRFENSYYLYEFRLFTDLRIIDKDEDSEEEPTYGVILHKIQMEFMNDNEQAISIYTDREKLLLLKSEIEKAIDREENIKKSLGENFKLV